jgi:hypothetical protein
VLCVTLLVMLVAALGGLRAALAAAPLPRLQRAAILANLGNITRTNTPGQAQFDKAMPEGWRKASYTTPFEVSATPITFEEGPLPSVFKRVVALGKTIKATVLNAYQVFIPMEGLQFEPILAMKANGRVTTARDKGQFWIANPRDANSVLHAVKYDSRWVWQLSKLHIE